MKIQEVQQRTGVPKKNIRFYEAEGLLAPARAGNQYREYSEADVEILLQIKLLRRLGLPLEEIRLIRQGRATLANGMHWRAEHLGEEIRRLQRTRALCRRIAGEGRELDALKTTAILAEMDEMEAKGERFSTAVKETAARVKRFLPPTPVHDVETPDIIRSTADVDKALVEYAARNGYDLTILKGHSWEPVVLLDGRKLWGMAHIGRFGRRLFLYKSWEESQYSTSDNIAIKHIANLFKKRKDKNKP